MTSVELVNFFSFSSKIIRLIGCLLLLHVLKADMFRFCDKHRLKNYFKNGSFIRKARMMENYLFQKHENIIVKTTWLKAYKIQYRSNKGDKQQKIKLYGLSYVSCNDKQILKIWIYTTEEFSGYIIVIFYILWRFII